jgi:hypothetical protein
MRNMYPIWEQGEMRIPAIMRREEPRVFTIDDEVSSDIVRKNGLTAGNFHFG